MDSEIFYSKVDTAANVHGPVYSCELTLFYRAKARILQHKAEQDIPLPLLRKSRKELHDRLKVDRPIYTDGSGHQYAY